MTELDKTCRIERRDLLFVLFGAGLVFTTYLLSHPKGFTPFETGSPYTYTFLIAKELLHGELGVKSAPPSWLNEFVPWLDGYYYSVFPLGAVLSVLPVAALVDWGILSIFPSQLISGFLGGATFVLSYWLVLSLSGSRTKAVLYAALLPLGTWSWMNITFGGAWQLALGFAEVGLLGAFLFSLVYQFPFWCGAAFALGFGNRTELLVVAPLFLYLLFRNENKREKWLGIGVQFVTVPVLLGGATLWYNWARFGSPFEFGYALIPGVLDEPWYRHGIFSLKAIPENVHHMLFRRWRWVETPPYLLPTGFGSSIFLACPFLILLFRWRVTEWRTYGAVWLSALVVCLIVWCHGNTGGWQFSYRYAIELLPFFLIILVLNGKQRVTALEVALCTLSVVINGYAVWVFYWSGVM